MIVVYDPKTLIPYHFVTFHMSDYSDHLETRGETYLMTEEIVAPQDLSVAGDPQTGRPRLYRRDGETRIAVETLAPLPIVAPEALQVGAEAAFTAVPEGVSIAVNGAPQGAMDASCRLEFTPASPGRYRFRFSGPGWITKEVALEAHA